MDRGTGPALEGISFVVSAKGSTLRAPFQRELQYVGRSPGPPWKGIRGHIQGARAAVLHAKHRRITCSKRKQTVDHGCDHRASGLS